MTNYWRPPHYVENLFTPSGEELEVVGEYQGGGSYTVEREDDGYYINEVDQPEFDFPLVYTLEDKTLYVLTLEQEKVIKSQFIRQYWENVE